MKPDQSLSPDAADLRRRAEDRLRERQTQADQPPADEETRRLIHDLQVHQVELELQNHALLKLRHQLEQSLERYTDLYDFAPVGYFTLTADGAIRELNLAGAALLGQERSRLIDRRFGLFVSGQTRSDFNAFVDRTLVGTSREHCEIALDLDGMPPCHLRLEGVAARDGEEALCHLAAMDITERKRAEAALRASEEKYRTVADFTYDWEYWRDPQGRYVYVSPSCERITGYRPEDFLADPDLMSALIHPDDREEIARHFAGIGEPAGLLEFRIVTRAGEERWIGHACLPVYGADGRWLGQRGSNRDITAHKRATEALIQSEARFHGLIDHVPSVSVQGYDADGTIHYWNDASETVYGYTAREAVGRKLVDLIIPPEMRPEVRQAIRRMAATGQPLPAGELSLLHKDGSRVEVFSNHAVVQIPGRAPELFCLDIDIAYRKRMEQRIQQAQITYRGILDGVEEAILIQDETGAIIDANRAAEKICGYPRDVLIGKKSEFFAAPGKNDLTAITGHFQKALAGKTQHFEFWAIRSDGSIYLKEMDLIPGAYFGDKAVIAVGRDITDRKRADDALRAALEEKEVLLREVHHRVKNNLAAVGDLLELQRESVTDGPTSFQLTDLGHRIKAMALVHEMLYQSDSLSQIDFRGYLQALVAHLRDSLDPRDTIRIDVAATSARMNLDAAIPCGLIVAELVTNAFKHAFPEPGSRPESGARRILVSADQSDVGYILTVADNGAGLPAELDWRTTRTLGLRLVRMLGQHQLRGQIEFDRTGGTRFSLRFGNRRHAGSNRRET